MPPLVCANCVTRQVGVECTPLENQALRNQARANALLGVPVRPLGGVCDHGSVLDFLCLSP